MAVLLILWPIAELFAAIEVARAIGVLETIVLLILSWPLGIWADPDPGGGGVAAVDADPGRTPCPGP